jgi:hypothetical protein
MHSDVYSPRQEHSQSSISGWSANLRRENSSYSFSSERQYLLEGHSAPGKLWRENSTFRDMAKMRLAVEVPELAELYDERIRGDDSSGAQGIASDQKNTFDWSHVHQQSMQRQQNLREQMTDDMASRLSHLEAVEDLLEVRRDGHGSWYLRNGKCLHWSEQQQRLAAESLVLEREYESRFGEGSVVQRWTKFSRRIVHHVIAHRFNILRIEYDLAKVVYTQKCAQRFLQKKRARAKRAAMWRTMNSAATKIQSIIRMYRDAVYCKVMAKCKAFLEKHHNVFITHKAFVRAKREYSGTIEPPLTATAFANMGDAQGSAEYAERTLTFVEFCKAISDHLQRAASCPLLARSTSTAILRVSSGPKSGLISRAVSHGPAILTRSLSMEQLLDSMTPFSKDQEEVLHIAQSTARLFYLYDTDHLGVLSERQFSNIRRELSISTGVEINQKDAACALRSVPLTPLKRTPGPLFGNFS